MPTLISHIREVGDHIKHTLKKVFISQNNVREVRDKQGKPHKYMINIHSGFIP